MQPIYTNQITVKASDCDYNSLLSYPDIFALCMDIAKDHSYELGNSEKTLTPQGLYWLVTKTKVRIQNRPADGDRVEMSTWPEKPNRIRAIRNYRIARNGETLIEAATEWTILNRNTGRLTDIIGTYPADLSFCQNTLVPEGFIRFPDINAETFAQYTVRSVDIDFEGHMNNVSYIRALFGLFSRAELDQLAPREIEVHYKASCYEGDTLYWQKQTLETGTWLRASLQNQTTILLVHLQ